VTVDLLTNPIAPTSQWIMAAIAQEAEVASPCCYLSPSMSFEHVSSYASFDRNLTAIGCPSMSLHVCSRVPDT
jgi:hypothetical protein